MCIEEGAGELEGVRRVAVHRIDGHACEALNMCLIAMLWILGLLHQSAPCRGSPKDGPVMSECMCDRETSVPRTAVHTEWVSFFSALESHTAIPMV